MAKKSRVTHKSGKVKSDRITITASVLASWCGVSADRMRRFLQRFGLPSKAPYELREIVRAMFERMNASADEILTKDNGKKTLAQLKTEIEIANLRQRRDWIQARTEIMRREWVRVDDVRERATALAAAMRQSGEQLGRRFGPEAQDVFNGALDIGIASLLSVQSPEIEPELPLEYDDGLPMLKPKKTRAPRKRTKADK